MCVNRWRVVLLAPPAAEGAVELDYGEELVEAGLDERILSGEKLLLLLENLVVAGLAQLIALNDHLHGFAVSADRALVFDACLDQVLPGKQGVRDFAKSIEHGLLVLQPILLARGFGLMQLRSVGATLENGSSQVGSPTPRICRAAGNRR